MSVMRGAGAARPTRRLRLTWRRYFHLAHPPRLGKELRGTRVYARACAKGRAARWPTVVQAGSRKALRQPDLLPSPVIIIIKSTLRAVRALVKECFISPTRPPPCTRRARPSVGPSTAFRQPRGYITYGKPPRPSLGPSTLRQWRRLSFPQRVTHVPFDRTENVKIRRGLAGRTVKGELADVKTASRMKPLTPRRMRKRDRSAL